MKVWSLRSATDIGSADHPIHKLVAGVMLLLFGAASYANDTDPYDLGTCERMLTADVVALDMPLMWNRLGAQNINGMMYALKRDVVKLPDNIPLVSHLELVVAEAHDNAGEGEIVDDEAVVKAEIANLALSGDVALRPDKRPRPLVLRMGKGDCMAITLTNLLHPVANPFQVPPDPNAPPEPPHPGDPPAPPESDNGPVIRSGIEFKIHNDNQIAARRVSLRFQGTQLVNSIDDDGSNVGLNDDATIGPGESTTYTIYGQQDGAFVGASYGGVVGGEGLGGTTASGLFAALNVNPRGSAFYRNAISNEELALATVGYTPDGQPIVDYEAVYPMAEPWISEAKAGLPILNMFQSNGAGGFEIVHNNLDAIVAYGPDFMLATPDSGGYDDFVGHFPETIYPLESVDRRNPTVPNRLEPFREFTVIFHDEVQTMQVLPKWFDDPVFVHTLHGVRDAFMINYGSGGIGGEILANRFKVGPMHDCVNCMYEEFFLSFHTIGEVGQLVDVPANAGLENCEPNQLADCGATGPKANYVLFPDDPSNVHHGYVGDNTAFRNLHAGPGEQHVFHLHNHQWLWNADDDNSNYLDAQGLGPGSGYAYWVNFGGAGNRNRTAGDAIFHCHFYPHFAQGMWEMWRIHDTFEIGTELVAQQPTVDYDNDYVPDGRVSFVADGLGIGNGTPLPGARALPDGEIVAGAPTPAVVPLPGKRLAPMPAAGVTVRANPNEVEVCADEYDNTVVRMPDGSCPFTDQYGAEITMMRPVGSLTEVDRTAMASHTALDENGEVILDVSGAPKTFYRYGAYGYDGEFGTEDDVNVGYPFWHASMEHTVGNRPTTPPLDMITQGQAKALQDGDSDFPELWQHQGWNARNAIDGWDGGLPRFGVQGYAAGGQTVAAATRFDMSKEIIAAKPVFFPEEGTDLEQIAMAYHAQRCHDSWRVLPGYEPFMSAQPCTDDPYEGGGYYQDLWGNSETHGGFLTNGNLPIGGAPYFEPCIDDRGVLMDGYAEGYFFDGKSNAPIWDTAAMTTEGRSRFTAYEPRVYKGANVQFDAVFNKLGYHFPQQRIVALWQDVVPTIKQERPPEPFVMRMNTFDCTQYVHSNVVPKQYELDDYQVRTPTDVIGQHIHLPKWDLVSADGSGNGWNYEDGVLSPEAVVEMIEAINHFNESAAEPVDYVYVGGGIDDPWTREVRTSAFYHEDYKDDYADDYSPYDGDELHLIPLDHPFFGKTEFAHRWEGARSEHQRWFADPVVNVQGVDRGLGIIFTHDHFGPSTHQQVGLYATMLIEPAGSKWLHNETGVQLHTRTDNPDPAMNDGGPTSWQAQILTGAYGIGGTGDSNVGQDDIENYREFFYQYSDFQHAYQPGVFTGIRYDGNFDWIPVEGEYHIVDTSNPPDGIADIGMRDGAPYRQTFRDALQPPYRLQASIKGGTPVLNPDGSPVLDEHGLPTLSGGFPVDIWEFPPDCLGGVVRPCPEAITANDPGLYVVNYRNESVTSRVFDPNKLGPDGQNGAQADGRAGDLAWAMSSKVQRAIPELNDVMGLAPATYFDGECPSALLGDLFCPPINDPKALNGGDPFTPMARVYDGDNVKIRMHAGGQEEEHGTTIHGLKWLQSGSGFGEAKNSGWRNAQAGGISEQFSLRMPIFADYGSRGNQADHAWSMNPSIDGWVSGSWGVIRTNKPGSDKTLATMPNEATSDKLTMVNQGDYNGVCPIDAPLRQYDITAVSVNDVLDKPAGVIIQDLFPGAHVGASPDPDGGTLVYNPRNTEVDAIVDPLTGEVSGGGMGPLHDPTGIIYVETNRLVAKRPGGTGRRDSFVPDDPYCWVREVNKKGRVSWEYDPTLSSCEVVMVGNQKIEPVVIRANAGDCIEVTLRNKVLRQAFDDQNGNRVFDPGVDYRVFNANGNAVFENLFLEDVTELDPNELIWYADVDFDGVVDTYDGLGDLDVDPQILAADLPRMVFDETMDLANGNAIGGSMRRDDGRLSGNGMTTFNNNLMKPSAHVGMRPQLVEYDVTRSDGFNVGQNSPQTAGPGGAAKYQWYAGITDIDVKLGRRNRLEGTLSSTPIEYGGFNILSADPVEQGQKGLVAAGVIYPKNTYWLVDPGRTTAASVYDASNGQFLFRDFTTIATKGASIFYHDSYPVENQEGEGNFGIAEDAQDMGHMAINLGNEAMWFRFGKNPTHVGGNANCEGLGSNVCLGGLPSGEAVKAYSNSLVGSDPETAVFEVTAGDEFRMHVLMPFMSGRGSTFDLHGHVWQRDPYVCPDDADLTLEGKCGVTGDPYGWDGLPRSGSVGSQALGINPIGMYLGGIESWFAAEHYEIFIPRAGGNFEVPGDYLFRDHMGLGNAGGLWGIVRVLPK